MTNQTACILNHDFARRLVEESVADGDGLVWSGGAEPPNTKIHFLFFRLLSLFWSLNDRPSQMANEMLARRGDSMYMTGQCSVTVGRSLLDIHTHYSLIQLQSCRSRPGYLALGPLTPP